MAAKSEQRNCIAKRSCVHVAHPPPLSHPPHPPHLSRRNVIPPPAPLKSVMSGTDIEAGTGPVRNALWQPSGGGDAATATATLEAWRAAVRTERRGARVMNGAGGLVCLAVRVSQLCA